MYIAIATPQQRECSPISVGPKLDFPLPKIRAAARNFVQIPAEFIAILFTFVFMIMLTWRFVCGLVPLYDRTRVTIFAHSRTGQKHWWFDLYISTYSFWSSFFWYSKVILTQSAFSMSWSCRKSDFPCRSGLFHVWWYLLFSFTMLLTSSFTRSVASLRKIHHRWVMTLLLLILSGRGRVLLRWQLLVITFVVSRLYIHFCIPWRSVPTRMTMTHLGLLSGRFLNIYWILEIAIQRYLWTSPELVSSLVIWLVWWFVRRQPRQVVFSSGWIRPQRHFF